MPETIVAFLKRNLLEVGAGKWEQIAAEAGVAKSLPRKIAYGDRSNPGVETIQPLVTYFQQRQAQAQTKPEKAEA